MSTTPTGKWDDFPTYSRRFTVGNSRFCNPNTKCFCIENFNQSQLALLNHSGSTEAFPAFPSSLRYTTTVIVRDDIIIHTISTSVGPLV